MYVPIYMCGEKIREQIDGYIYILYVERNPQWHYKLKDPWDLQLLWPINPLMSKLVCFGIQYIHN